jgi:hypothetical protein
VNGWLWLLLAVLAAMAAGFFALLGVSAGTAYGANYHSLSTRQKWMGATLYRGSVALAVASAGLAALAVALAVRQWIA